MSGYGTATGSLAPRESDGPPGDLVDAWVAAPSCFSPSPGPAGQIAYISDRDGVPQLWIRDRAGASRRIDTGAGHVRSVVWSPEGTWIAVEIAPGGGDHIEVRVVRPGGTGLRCLAGGRHPAGGPPAMVAPEAPVAADAPAVEAACAATPVYLVPAVSMPVSPGHVPAGTLSAGLFGGAGPEHGAAATLGRWTPDGAALAVCESVRSGMTHALLIDPENGRREHLAAGLSLAICDIDGDPGTGYRLLLREGPRGFRRMFLVDSASGRFYPLLDEAGTVGLGRFGARARAAVGNGSDADGPGRSGRGVIYLLSDAGRERAALTAVTLRDDGSPDHADVVAARDDADAERFVLLPPGGTEDRPGAVVAWNVAGRTVLEVVDLGTRHRTELPPLPRDVASSLLVTDGGHGLLLALVGSTVPGELWTYDFASAAAGYRCLVSDVPTAFPAPVLACVADPPVRPATVHHGMSQSHGYTHLVPPDLHRFRAHDGLELSGWMYRPRDAQGPCATVLFFHGGPEAQERPTFNPLFQALVTRGIAVFAPNVRGSAGYGRSFCQADNRGRRFDGIADVASCVRYLVGTGLADGERVGVAGRSYGGYLTLKALVTYPELFRVGVDICGMVDFATFYAHTEPWIAAPAATKYGDPVADADLLRELSPLHRMHHLAAPLLVVHGANDTNVPVIEAEQTVAAATARGVDCRYLLFDGEGHEIAGLANRTLFVRETVEWVSTYLLESLPVPEQLESGQQRARPLESVPDQVVPQQLVELPAELGSEIA